MIPEEDRGPAWLRDYGFTNFGDIAADINAMAEYAKKLAADVEANYQPHLKGMSAAMLTRLPTPNPAFYELMLFMESHNHVQNVTQNNVYAFGTGTSVLAVAAQKISDKYRGTDAFAHAKVADVHETLAAGAPVTPTTDGDF
jgi:hypothetical protein